MKKLVTPVAIIFMAITLFNSCKKEMDPQEKWGELIRK